MHRFLALSLALGLGALLVVGAGTNTAFAGERPGFEDGLGVERTTPVVGLNQTGFGTSQPDTVQIGYSSASSDPNKVGVGGVWDWDTDTAGTDSTQFWQFISADWRFESTTALPNATDRPWWYFDYGNETNRGDQNLWEARDAAGRSYRRTGVVGVWHQDDMSSVSTPILGSGSAWCGIRPAGAGGPVDAATNNAYDGSISHQFRIGASIQSSYPGYGNLWNQILYRDISVSGAGTEQLSFRLRTDLSASAGTESGGSAWFTPDPTAFPANFVSDPRDSFAVYVGLPQETGVYDTNRRWLSEVLDYTSANQPVKLFETTGKVPVAGSDTTVTVTIPALGGATTVRVAFQVHTNRGTNSDEITASGGFDSVDGAALIDDVRLDSVLIPGSDFESPTSILPRRYDSNGNGSGNDWVSADPANTWITTGKPPLTLGHVHNVFDLAYDDPCGTLTGPGAVGRQCDLIDNTMVMSNHDLGHSHIDVDGNEFWSYGVSPTINLAPGSTISNALLATLGSLSTSLLRVEYQIWTGTMGLDESVFWGIGGRYMGSGLPQEVGPAVANWSGINHPGFISFSPDPTCAIFNTDTDLDGIVPTPDQIDSLQLGIEIMTRCARFSATACGQTQGTYWDNIRAQYVSGNPLNPVAQFWDLFQDAFYFNEGITPGSTDMDTATALITQALNNAASSGGEGVIQGDTLAFTAAWAGADTRLDLVFRILPGPGNYSVAGDVNSSLIEKDGSAPFWATYLAGNGPHGTPGGHGGTWDPNVWNSARMDSGEANLWPIVGRDLGTPVEDTWQGTLHESDPNFNVLGIDRNVCFLVDPSGAADNTNICCDATECGTFFEPYPPNAYAGQTGGDEVTKEGTKILPDGYFSPGTHVEYFIRRSSAANSATNVGITPDTNVIINPPALGPHFDDFRWLDLDVLPDLWKDVRFGGSGLACMLVVDAQDRRGSEDALLGALDSLGYGKNNGAGQGYKDLDPGDGLENDPANHVPANLGQVGLAFDYYEIQASESAEGGRLGCRIATPPVDPALTPKQCKNGPSPDMLKTLYNQVIYFTADLDDGAIHDGLDNQEQSKDVDILQDFLLTAGSGDERAVWLDGDGISEDLAASGGQATTLLSTQFGANFIDRDYRTNSNNLNSAAFFIPTDAAFHPAREYGIVNLCTVFMDVIQVNPAGDGTPAEAARYESDGDRPDAGINPGNYTASVYSPSDGIAKFYSTLIDGFDIANLNGNGGGNTDSDVGRIAWVDDALLAFNLCSRVGPVIAVGELPGANGATLNFVRGSFPNPSVTGAATVQFSLAQPANVNIRFYNVAGRLVHEAKLDGLSAGANTYRWDGVTSSGMRAPSGVYFYRLTAPGISFQNNSQRMVLLGSAN